MERKGQSTQQDNDPFSKISYNKGIDVPYNSDTILVQKIIDYSILKENRKRRGLVDAVKNLIY